MTRPSRPGVVALGTAVALGIVVMMAASGPGLPPPPAASVPDWRPLPMMTPASAPTLSPVAQPGSESARGSDTVMMVMLGLVLLGALIALAYARKNHRDRRPLAPHPSEPPAGASIPLETTVTVDRSHQQLVAGTISGDQAVIAAWRAFETEAARLGVTRAPTETSDGYARRVAAATRVDAAGVSALERLFVRAVYGTGGVDADEARRCLDAIVRSWSS